jgi:hypothetical protein
MRNGITKAPKIGSRAAYMELGLFYGPNGEIHLTGIGIQGFHTTVNANEGSKRCHKNLHKKLADALASVGITYEVL